MPVPPVEPAIDVPLTAKGHPMPTVDGITDVRRCSLCHELRRPEEMYSAPNAHYCKHCEHPLATRGRKAREVQKKQARNAFLRILKQRHVSDSRLELLCDEVCNLYGGTKELASEYVKELKGWQKQHPYSQFTINKFEAFFRLIALCDRQKADTDPTMQMAQLTDEELQTMINHLAREVLEENMEVLDTEAIDEEPP